MIAPPFNGSVYRPDIRPQRGYAVRIGTIGGLQCRQEMVSGQSWPGGQAASKRPYRMPLSRTDIAGNDPRRRPTATNHHHETGTVASRVYVGGMGPG